MDDLSNSYLGQYQLIAVVGRGSTSTVYKARQAALDRYVAVKVLHQHVAAHFVSRFEQEARAIAALQHRNILPIYDYGRQGRLHYFVTQYVEGGVTLGDRLAGGPLDALEALGLMGHLLSALDYAHGRGVIHRDIKPSNILMPWPDWPMLADFGIAKLVGAAQQLTPPGQAVGTAAYMAPERAFGRVADARSDLYSVGVVLYELVTGRVPFEANTPFAVLDMHAHDPPPPPRSLVPGLHPSLEEALLRALEKNPDARYQSAHEMVRALDQVRAQVERARAQSWLARQLDPYKTHTLAPDQLSAAPPASQQAATPDETTTQMSRVAPSLAGAAGKRRRIGGLLGLVAAFVAAVLISLWSIGAPGSGAAPPPSAPADGAAQAPASDAPAAPVEEPAASVEEPAASVEEPAAPVEEPAAPVEEPADVAGGAAPVEEPAAPVEEPVSEAPPVSQSGASASISLDDARWSGGYNLSRGSGVYGGRTAMWIYGAATEYSTMRASFELDEQPVGEATLTVEGMDAETSGKAPISIRVNEVEIYRGPNPLPDDDLPLESGTWDSYSWSFDAALLQAGSNEVSISNLAEGGFGQPPFFMLDYATLTYGW